MSDAWLPSQPRRRGVALLRPVAVGASALDLRPVAVCEGEPEPPQTGPNVTG